MAGAHVYLREDGRRFFSLCLGSRALGQGLSIHVGQVRAQLPA